MKRRKRRDMEYPDMAEQVLTVEEVADELRVSTQTVHKLIREKKLKAFRVGVQVRVKRSDLDRYIQQSSL
jgi:excisionase family DNA binding protein